MRRNVVTVIIFTAMISIVTLTSPAAITADSEKSILFIFDSSSSMKDTLGGKAKIIIAKEVLSDLVDDLPQDANVGLLVYGNRVQNSCEIVDVTVPVKKLDREVMKNSIHPLEARGKTPIAFSLRKGADVVKALPGDKAIILISDGEETCGGNPIKTAEQIRQELGIQVVIHVVGFDVDEKSRMQLLGISKAGGGLYYSADSADELKKSLGKIKEEVIEKKPEPPPVMEPPKPEPPPVVASPVVEPPKPEPPEVIEFFSDQFDGTKLSENWTVLNPSPDNMVTDNGKCTFITLLGDMSRGTVKNTLLYEVKPLPENYEIIASLKTEIVGNFGDWDDGQLAGIILFQDKDNYLYVMTAIRTDNWTKTRVHFVKRSGGEKVPDFKIDIPCPNPGTYDFKIEKKKLKYTGYVGVQGEKGFEWKEIGSYTVIGKNFYPGIAAHRIGGRAKEVSVEFDHFRINELKSKE